MDNYIIDIKEDAGLKPHEILLANMGLKIESDKRFLELYKYSRENYFKHRRYRIFIRNNKDRMKEIRGN